MKIFLCHSVAMTINEQTVYAPPASGCAMYSTDGLTCILVTAEQCNGIELDGTNAEAEAAALPIWILNGVFIP